jgi:hypothetical protein
VVATSGRAGEKVNLAIWLEKVALGAALPAASIASRQVVARLLGDQLRLRLWRWARGLYRQARQCRARPRPGRSAVEIGAGGGSPCARRAAPGELACGPLADQTAGVPMPVLLYFVPPATCCRPVSPIPGLLQNYGCHQRLAEDVADHAAHRRDPPVRAVAGRRGLRHARRQHAQQRLMLVGVPPPFWIGAGAPFRRDRARHAGP